MVAVPLAHSCKPLFEAIGQDIAALSKVAEDLSKVGACCPYCTLRLLGCHNLHVYLQLAKHLNATDINPLDVDCATCLGMSYRLYQKNEDFLKQCVQALHDAWDIENRPEFNTFNVTFAIPLNILARDRCMRLYVRQCLEKQFKGQGTLSTAVDQGLDIKSFIGSLITTNLAREKDCLVSNASYSQDTAHSDLRLRLCVTCDSGVEASSPCKEAEECLEFLQAKMSFSKESGARKRKFGKIEHGALENKDFHVNGGDSEYHIGLNWVKRVKEDIALQLSKSVFGSFPPGPSRLGLGTPCGVVLGTASVFIGGYYVKMERGMTQTPDYHRASSPVLSQSISRELEAIFEAKGHKFGSAGREDEDVRMLGRGRPFLIEILNPLRRRSGERELASGHLEKIISANTHGGCTVRNLKICNRTEIELIRGAEEDAEKRKCYQAVVWSSTPLNDTGILNRVNAALSRGVAVSQQTPVRVMHRRALRTRSRMIYSGRLRPLPCGPSAHAIHFGLLDIETQGGTYIKELVHGDLGRTTPSLASLIGMHEDLRRVAKVDILQLDVTKVVFDWI